MTAQLSREIVENLLRHNDESDSPANAEAWEVNALCRLALAGMDSEPTHEATSWQVDEAIQRLEAEADMVLIPRGLIGAAIGAIRHPKHEAGVTIGSLRHYAYEKKPAPVAVPDELTREEYKRRFMEEDNFDDTYRGGWKDYRAAMLKHQSSIASSAGAGGSVGIKQPSSNEPVTGWIKCSEQMPDIGTEIFYFCQDDCLRDCGIVSSSNFSNEGDAQLYVHAEGYDLRFGVDITHWMPLPAAPEQEV